jgi:beta-glucosidase
MHSRKKKYYTCLILLTFAGLIVSFKTENIKPIYPYKNPALPVEQRVADLLNRMTLQEKILQLDMFWGKEITDMTGHEATTYSASKTAKVLGTTGIGSVHDFYPSSADVANSVQRYAMEKTRLGIPVLFIEEGLHGYEGYGSTTFPIPLQLASAWDTSLVHQIGRVVGTEARAHGVGMILGPVLCLPHDPRWGRVEETYGEDPYLDALNGVAMIKGLQGKKLSDHDAVVAEPKHFAVHGIPEGGSNTAPVNIGEREARSTFLYVFEKAVREGKAMGMMAAYSEIDGIPCVDNKWLLTDVLRKEWGFKGFVLSDLGAIRMSLENHAVASDTTDALVQTFNAGLNMQFYDFSHAGFLKSVSSAVQQHKLSVAQLNKTVADVLRVKFSLGLFDHPYIDPALVGKVFHTQASQDLALKAAQEGICLLKNDNNVLPLKNEKNVAVIGPLAQSTYLGGYSNKQGKGVSILDGLKQRAGDGLKISYEEGYSSDTTKTDLQKRAVELVKNSDAAIIVIGEDMSIVGEGKDRANLDLDERQLNLIKAIQATGKPIAAVMFNGRPLSINWVAKNIPSIVEAWFGGEKGGLAIADVLLGKVNPSGKLPITFPRSVGQLPFYYNHKPTSRHHYVDEMDTPLFPFGLGLSYTTFQYADMSITPAKIPVNGTATVSVKITNTGRTEGAEVVQLYLRDVVSSVTTPVMALKGFNRITLKPGESGVVRFKISSEHLSLWNRAMKQVVEPGEFKVMVGSSSADIRQNGNLWVRAK